MLVHHECRYCDSRQIDVLRSGSGKFRNGKFHVCCWKCLHEGPSADTEREAIRLFDNPAFLYGKINKKYDEKVPEDIRRRCLAREWWRWMTLSPFLYIIMLVTFGLPALVVFLSNPQMESLKVFITPVFAVLFVFLFENLMFFSALKSGMCDDTLTNLARCYLEENPADAEEK